MSKKKNKKKHNQNKLNNLDELLDRVEKSVFGDKKPEIAKTIKLDNLIFRRYKIDPVWDQYIAIEVTDEYIRISESGHDVLFGVAMHYFKSKDKDYNMNMDVYYKKIKLLR